MGRLPFDEAYFIGVWLGTLLFGVHIVVFIMFLWIIKRRPSHSINIPLALVATAMLMVGGANNIIALQRILTAFWGDTDGLSPAVFLNNVNLSLSIAESATWGIQITIGDAFLAYRCWAVYGKRWWVLAPSAALIMTACGLGIAAEIAYNHVLPEPGVNLEFIPKLARWEGTFVFLTVIHNLSLTIAIAGRVWWQYRRTYDSVHQWSEQSHYGYVMWLVVESGLLVALAQLAVLILGAMKITGYEIVLHAVTPIIGVVFTSVAFRIQLASGASAVSRSTASRSALEVMAFRPNESIQIRSVEAQATFPPSKSDNDPNTTRYSLEIVQGHITPSPRSSSSFSSSRCE